MELNIFDNYYLLPSEYDDAFHAYVMEEWRKMYLGEYVMNLDAVLSEGEKSKQRELSNPLGKPYQLNFYILHAKDKIGWCYGMQTDYETFSIANVAIAHEHRGKGILSAILPVILKTLSEKGFQKVCSKHAATNNSALVPFLRNGFLITGFEINDCDGIMVELTYFFNAMRKKVVDFRVGKATLTEEIAKVLFK